MKEEQFKVLKTMSETKSRMDMDVFAQRVNLSLNQTMQQMQELSKEGFLRKVGSGYGITKKGKAVLKVLTPIPKEMGFHFYFAVNEPTDFTAQTLEEFYRFIKMVRVGSLEFHLYRGDFENWLKEACKDPDLSDEIGSIKATGLKGEELRAELLKEFDAKYSIQDLL